MAEVVGASTVIRSWLDRAKAGDPTARDELIRHSCERLRRLTSRMLGSYEKLRRWEQTDDVLQTALVRLHRSLADVQPGSVREFFGLAATQIRRTLLDLARHHYGPHGIGAHHHTDNRQTVSRENRVQAEFAPDAGDGPSTLHEWTEFHQQVEKLPDQERETFNLIWYEGLTQAEVANILSISLRTVKRRWQSARIALCEAMYGDMPE